MIYIQKRPKISLMDNRYLSRKTYSVSQVMTGPLHKRAQYATYTLDRYAAGHRVTCPKTHS